MTRPTFTPRARLGVRRARTVAVALVAAAVFAGSVRLAVERSVTHTVTTTVYRFAGTTGVRPPDACGELGCHTDEADPDAVHAVGTALPSAAIISHYALGDSGRRRFQYIAAQTTDGIELTVQSRCSPPSAAMVGRDFPPADRGPAWLAAVRVTGPGCTVGVVAQVPDGVVVPRPELVRLLDDPRLRLDGE